MITTSECKQLWDLLEKVEHRPQVYAQPLKELVVSIMEDYVKTTDELRTLKELHLNQEREYYDLLKSYEQMKQKEANSWKTDRSWLDTKWGA